MSFKVKSSNYLLRNSLFMKNFCYKKINIKNHLKNLNLPNSKLLSKEEIRSEFLKQAKLSHPDLKSSPNVSESTDFTEIKNSYDYIINNYDDYCKFVDELISIKEEKPVYSKKIHQSKYLNHIRRNQQYQQERHQDYHKDEEKFRINLSFLARYKWIAVIFSKQMRRIYPDTYQNVIVFGVFILCIFLYFWRLYGFKVTYLGLKPVELKPLITKKIIEEQKLTIEDLNFIYENNDEYELESSVLKDVEKYRKQNKLSIIKINSKPSQF